ncbi:DgyrCDS9295 [Dimorphilus gyrociliatus]|uniref:DgyrCDS9295 n=1 Tax=Dimorphilus gyrociliatus TaxID=2664684 RepID=A0A7I8VXW1_9ANNE|nr:DgyrCDS9295 [Dimorphilus gyrociliatus]
MDNSLSTKIQTVTGLIEPTTLGITLAHEHLYMEYPMLLEETENSHIPMTLENYGWISRNPWQHIPNLKLFDVEAVKADLMDFKKFGGSAVVECTTKGLKRDIQAVKKISEETGVKVVAGAGYYVDSAHPPEMIGMSVEDIAESIKEEVLVGYDGVKCGLIGEIGCSWPLTDAERKVLKGAAIAQADLGCGVSIHPGRNHRAPMEIIRILSEAGCNIDKVVISHIDRTVQDYCTLMDLLDTTCYLEYDLFGVEVINYPLDETIDFLSDSQRVAYIKRLVDDGFADKIVVAQDIHTLHRLKKYGGHGFCHILENIVPKMLVRDISRDAINQILISNPANWLLFT